VGISFTATMALEQYARRGTRATGMSTANGNAAHVLNSSICLDTGVFRGKIGPTYSPTVIAAHRAKR
jgi:hypothetical protein